ncbi:uncharacterized protein EI90DRAFT_3158184 [Cantharellus anzutake]|uniref:uncharacterized protein n=1 Tax=Cantharellus anzutake TaxID=1750568 RepID=UPI001908DF87|nr:uncharacterized protein EI90DRAFT_3158184 [Cantharellus anzutake]KAF8319907.1 hypothetical protein EI90DRAFT_3158184 [Cantharellus anzutake]
MPALNKSTSRVIKGDKIKCGQCDQDFLDDNARRSHVRIVHQAKLTIGDIQLTRQEDGSFHCPTPGCHYFDHDPANFRRHKHVKGGNESNLIPTRPLQGEPSSNPHAVAISSTPTATLAPSIPEVRPQPEDSEDQDDNEDPDYLPSSPHQEEIHFPPQQLMFIEELCPLQIGIDPTHRLIVCEGCQCGVPRQSLENHITQSHGGRSQVPTNLDTILNKCQVPQDVMPPTSKAIPVASLPIRPGFMCGVPGCGYASISHETIHRHIRRVHKGFLAQENTLQAQVQLIFSARPVYQVWAVDSNYSMLAPGYEHRSALDMIKAHDESGWDDGTIRAPCDSVHVNGFLREYGWLRIIKGKNYKELCGMVETPSQRNSALLPLKDKLTAYINGIREVVEEMAPLLLRWINTPEGQVYIAFLCHLI